LIYLRYAVHQNINDFVHMLVPTLMMIKPMCIDGFCFALFIWIHAWNWIEAKTV
jgi:hypothetical protein